MTDSAKKPNEAARVNWERYTAARDAGHSTYVKEAKRFDEFYMGKQWDEGDRQFLEDEGRPVLTINHVLSTVNVALGEQVNRRADITFKPKRGKASQAVAEVLTRLVDHILEENRFSKEREPQVFADGLIQDRGYYDVRMDFSENIFGEIRIEDEDPVTVIPDPQAKSYDPRKWNEVFITRWLPIDEIEVLYGADKAQELRNRAFSGESYGGDSIEVAENRFGDRDEGDTSVNESADGVTAIRSVRVIERQYYKNRKVRIFVDRNTGESREIPDSWDEERIAVMQQRFGFAIREKTKRQVRHCITADNVVLHDDWSIYRSFTIVPYFPYFRRGRPFGMVRNLISPQEMLNKSRSQELHIINTTANSGWIVEEGSLANMTTAELAENGAASGIVISHNPGTPEPKKIKPNPVPTGIDRISAKGEIDIKEISGISAAMNGFENAEVSGVALEHKASRGQVQLQVPFGHLELSRAILAEKVLELVQDFYTEERVFHITNYDEPEQPREELTVNQIDASGQVVNDLTVGEYEVVAASAPARDTFDEMIFAEALGLRNAGVMVPDHIVVEHSHLPRKQQLARLLKEINGFAELSPEEQQMAQMQQQAQIEQMQKELEKLDSEIAELQSRAMLNTAKAEDLSTGSHIKQIRDLEQKRKVKQKDIELRTELARLSSATQRANTDKNNAAKIAADAMKLTHSTGKPNDAPTR